jgi:hypothetical protein
VESVGEDPAAPLPEAIQRPSHADGESLHAAGERAAVLGFDDQVDVVRLEGELVQAEPEALAADLESAENS